MNARLFLFAALAAAPLCGQFQLSAPQGDVEKPVVSQYDFGSLPVGDAREVRFRARNISSSAASITFLSVGGDIFTLLDPPPLPIHVDSGAYVDFLVRFQPPATGLYSAALRVNNLSPILRGTGVAAATVFLETGGARTRLISGSAVDFGEVERRSSAARHIVLENPFGQRLTIRNLAVSGEFFRIDPPPALPLTLEPGGSVAFDVLFEPLSAGIREGALDVDDRNIVLRAKGVEPPLPKPRIALESSALGSAQQGKLSIRFEAEARTSGSGRVVLDFQPAAGGFPRDPAIVFPSTNSPAATFTVTEGQSQARFGDKQQIEFQTGTTAGTLTIRAELGPYTEQTSLTLNPAPVGIDAASGLRTSSGLEVYIAGWDNTRSAGQLSFTFYGPAGAVVAGPIRADAAAAFQRYFQSSEVGGIFSLRALFPVTGDASGVGGVEVEIVNSSGTTRSKRIAF